MHAIEERLGDASVSPDEHDAMLERYSALQDRFRIEEGYSIDLKVATVLRGLGFTDETFEQPTDSLSGGWQMRLALAKLLLGRPTLLLLDEPTNHLDLEARNWLEEYLSAYPHAVILVSHDRFFLDAVVTRITDLNLRKLTDYPGNYSHYIVERDARMEQLRKAKREQDEEIARVKMFIDRFRYQATKAAQVQSRIKMLEKVVPIEAPPERKRIHFTFPVCAKSGRSVLELHDVRKAYGEKVIFSKLNLLIERGDRIALVGPNGAGKIDADADALGRRSARRGHAARRSSGRDAVLRAGRSDAARPDAVGLRDDVGGFADEHGAGHPQHPRRASCSRATTSTRRRACCPAANARGSPSRACCCIPSNTLLLDEPTNHLDLDSKDILLEALEDYGGTLIFVSHDRYFVEKLATKIVEIGHGEAVVFPGTYSEFLWSKEHASRARRCVRLQPSAKAGRRVARRRRAADRSAGAPSRGSAEARKEAAASRRLTTRASAQAAEQRKRDQAAKKVQAQISDLEARIAEREQAMREIEAAMSAPGFYENRDQAQPLIDRHQTLMWELGDLMHQWEELQKIVTVLPPN